MVRAHVSPARILLIRTDRLGEAVLTLPILSALRRASPDAYLGFLATPLLCELVAGSPAINRCLPYDAVALGRHWPARAWRLAEMLRRERFDMALVANASKESHLAVWLARIPRRVGYARKWGHLLSIAIDDRRGSGGEHEVNANLRLLRAAGIETLQAEWMLPAYEAETEYVRARLRAAGWMPGQPVVLVHPWSSVDAKRWPVERYGEVIKRLANERQAWVAVVGGEAHATEARAELPASPCFVNWVGDLRIRELAALLRAADVLVSNDSGPVHMAAAMGTPTVALFGAREGPAGPARWGPWGPGHYVITGTPVASISVEDVYVAVCRRLPHAGTPAAPQT